MRSVSSSPRTPGHRRRLSNLEMTSPLWYQDESSPVRASHSRQSSLQSPITPRTPRTPNRRLSHGAASSVRISPRSGGGGIIGGGNGLGSLADELAEAWDEDGEGEETMERSGVDSQMDGCIESTPSRSHASTSVRQGGGSMNARASPGRTTENGYTRLLGSPPKLKDLKKASQRQVPRLDKDDDVSAAMPNGISAGVEARMTEVEMLVKRGLRSSDDGHGDDKVIEQALGSLQDLGGQANVEGGTTRSVPLLSRDTTTTIATQVLTYRNNQTGICTHGTDDAHDPPKPSPTLPNPPTPLPIIIHFTNNGPLIHYQRQRKRPPSPPQQHHRTDSPPILRTAFLPPPTLLAHNGPHPNPQPALRHPPHVSPNHHPRRPSSTIHSYPSRRPGSRSHPLRRSRSVDRRW